MGATELRDPRSPELRILLERGFVEQCSDLEALDNALSKGMTTFYVGYDPTASSLHIGNLVTIMAVRVLQQHGHRPILLLGGGTAQIGDPSGKSETRKLLTPELVQANALRIKGQFENLIHFDSGKENDAIMLDNTEWLMKLGYVEFLRDIGKHFTVNRMIAAKTYRDRLESELPLSFLEFNYQLLQAYDYLHLYRQHGCRLQMGGSDQWGNMIAGVELIRRTGSSSDGEESEDGEGGDKRCRAHCLTFPLLTTADGRKMGKTEKGAVWLDPERFSPFEYYQFWYNCADADIAKLMRIFTELPLEEIEGATAVEGDALNRSKAKLAYEATKMLHGENEAERAREASEQAFRGGSDWSALPCIEIPTQEIGLLDLLVHPSLQGFKSKRDARQRIKDRAVHLDGEVCDDPNRRFSLADIPEEGIRLQVGKKRRYRVRLTGEG